MQTITKYTKRYLDAHIFISMIISSLHLNQRIITFTYLNIFID